MQARTTCAAHHANRQHGSAQSFFRNKAVTFAVLRPAIALRTSGGYCVVGPLAHRKCASLSGTALPVGHSHQKLRSCERALTRADTSFGSTAWLRLAGSSRFLSRCLRCWTLPSRPPRTGPLPCLPLLR